MYIIRSARVASIQEKTDLLKRLIGNGNYKKQFSYYYCIKNESFIKDAYNQFYNDYRLKKYNEYKEQIRHSNIRIAKNYSDRKSNYTEDLNNWNRWIDLLTEQPNNTFCECGSSLRYIKSHDFIGCSNYSDFTQSHTAFNKPFYREDQYIIQKCDDFNTWDANFEYSKMYLHYFKKDYNLPNDLMQSILYEFIHGIWKLPKITNDLDSNFYTTRDKVNKRSKKEEQIIYNVLKSKFNVVLDQPMIIYNIEGDNKTKCFPDFICSNDDIVLVIDVKKNPSQIDDDRLTKYHELVQYICDSTNINKTVITKYYFYDTVGYTNYNTSNEITLNQISLL